MVLTGGNVNDTIQFDPGLDRGRLARAGPDRPATRPYRVLADKGYSSRAYRSPSRDRATIPARRDQQVNRPAAGSGGVDGHPRSTNTSYKRRNVVERCFNRFKQYRAIATRYDRTATSYRAMIDLATLLMWL